MTIEAPTIGIDRTRARELWLAYRKHQHYSRPIDKEIARAYQLIAQGRVVIRALDAIVQAGLGADGLPKLALCRAHVDRCWMSYTSAGRVIMASRSTALSEWRSARGDRFVWDEGKFPPAARRDSWRDYESIVPIVPLNLRPKRGLQNYHVLYEAEWSRRVPVDPMLLRQIGKGDLWLVVAAWDLTEIEQAALQARVSG